MHNSTARHTHAQVHFMPMPKLIMCIDKATYRTELMSSKCSNIINIEYIRISEFWFDSMQKTSQPASNPCVWWYFFYLFVNRLGFVWAGRKPMWKHHYSSNFIPRISTKEEMILDVFLSNINPSVIYLLSKSMCAFISVIAFMSLWISLNRLRM